MKTIKKIGLVSAVAFALFAFNACGDDSNSTSASGENGSSHMSSSTPIEDLDESSSSINDNSSSSSVILSDSEGSSSSSSAKGDGKSSSSNHEINSSSSSQSEEINCKWFCTSECEGSTRWRNTTTKETCRNGEWQNIDSLENLNKSSSSYYDMSEQFNPDIEYGSMTDPRDGKIYKTVKVKYDFDGADSITIFAENLNYGKLILGGSVQSDSTKYCYNDDPWYCDNGFGGLYSWSNAMNFPAACDSNALGTEKCPNKFDLPTGFAEPELYVKHQGVCPKGWHVMNGGEWAIALLKGTSESAFASIYGSKAVFYGSNKYGVSILPGGQWESNHKKYLLMGNAALYFCPQEYKYDNMTNLAYYVGIHSNSFNRTTSLYKSSATPIRCVQNY